MNTEAQDPAVGNRPILEDPGHHFNGRMWERAQQYIAEGRIEPAQAVLENLIRRQPDRFAARMLLASVHLKQGRVREAADQATLASRCIPEDADAVAAMSECLLRIGEVVTARDSLAAFDAKAKDLDGPHLRLLARTYQKLGDNATALELMTRAHAAGYDNADFHYFLGLQFQFHARFDDAQREMRACLRMLPTYGRAALALARLAKRSPDPRRLEFIREQLPVAPRGTEEHAAFEFAQFEELEGAHEFVAAFAALARGNRIMHEQLADEVRLGTHAFNEIARIGTREFVHGPGLAGTEGPVPIFIVGLPRSGTTVLDRMLDNHPDVVSTGERNDFPLQLRWSANVHGNHAIDLELLNRIPDLDYAELGRRYLEQTQWRAEGRAFYVDKLPPNHLLVGLIHRALPFAPILQMDRAPMSVCFSNYKALFGNSYAYSYDVGELATHYGLYRRLMAHWHAVLPEHLMTVDYRELVADPEPMLSRIFAYCGLRPAAGCSDLTRNQTHVSTMSCVQVRQPVYRDALNDWARYGDQLAPLQEALAREGFSG